MTVIETLIRPARPQDAEVLTELVHYASHGLAHHFWGQSAEPGEDPWAVGLRRQREKIETDEIYVIDPGSGAVAGLTGYLIGMAPEEITPDTPPIIHPLIALENLAPGTWYINVLAALPQARGKGYGSALIGKAQDLARARGAQKLSLIVADDNPGAQRLYERHGFRVTETRPMIKDGWETPGTEWALMIRDL